MNGQWQFAIKHHRPLLGHSLSRSCIYRYQPLSNQFYLSWYYPTIIQPVDHYQPLSATFRPCGPIQSNQHIGPRWCPSGVLAARALIASAVPSKFGTTNFLENHIDEDVSLVVIISCIPIDVGSCWLCLFAFTDDSSPALSAF